VVIGGSRHRDGAIITSIGLNSQLGNMAFITLNVASSGSPACNSNGTWAFVLPLNTALQNSILAQLAARAAQIPVSLISNGLCDTFGSVETLVFVVT